MDVAARALAPHSRPRPCLRPPMPDGGAEAEASEPRDRCACFAFHACTVGLRAPTRSRAALDHTARVVRLSRLSGEAYGALMALHNVRSALVPIKRGRHGPLSLDHENARRAVRVPRRRCAWLITLGGRNARATSRGSMSCGRPWWSALRAPRGLVVRSFFRFTRWSGRFTFTVVARRIASCASLALSPSIRRSFSGFDRDVAFWRVFSKSAMASAAISCAPAWGLNVDSPGVRLQR